MLVSEADQRILSFLAKFRFVPVEIIRAELFAHQRTSSVKPYVSRRLKHLRDLGLVQSEYILVNRRFIPLPSRALNLWASKVGRVWV